jgi:hypothetical protein
MYIYLLVRHDCRGVKDKDLNIKVDPTYISAETLVYKDGGVGSEDAFGEGTVKGRDDYYMKVYICMNIYIYIYIYICVCMCVYI